MKNGQKQVYLQNIETKRCIVPPQTYTFTFSVPPKIEILDQDKNTHSYDVIKLLDKLSKNIEAGELAYLQKENSDLKDEVELLQKKLEIAVGALEKSHDFYSKAFYDPELSERWFVVCQVIIGDYIDKALDQITTLEQKDVK